MAALRLGLGLELRVRVSYGGGRGQTSVTNVLHSVFRRCSEHRQSTGIHVAAYYTGTRRSATGNTAAKVKVNGVQQFARPLGELTCHMGSHSATCHPAEVTLPPLPPADAGTRLSDPGRMQG